MSEPAVNPPQDAPLQQQNQDAPTTTEEEKEFHVVDENGDAVELTDEEYQRLKSELAEQDANDLGQPMYQAPQLDHKLAVIEEQFRKTFDERLANPQNAAKKTRWEDPDEAIRTNKIFREVSRALAGDWGQIFDELVANLPPDQVGVERVKINAQPVLIQGYKALMSWREIAGRTFNMTRLVDALRKHGMDDIADAVDHMIDNEENQTSKESPAKPVQRRKSDVTKSKPSSTTLDNRRLLLVAKKIGGDWSDLAKELKIAEEDAKEIREAEKDSYQGAFKILWAWKESQQEAGASDKEVENLKNALDKVGKKEIGEELLKM